MKYQCPKCKGFIDVDHFKNCPICEDNVSKDSLEPDFTEPDAEFWQLVDNFNRDSENK